MPLNKNKKKNNLNNLNLNIKNLNTIKNAEMEIKSHSNKKQFNTLTKLSFSKNKNHLVKINSSNNYNTYNDNSAKKNDKNNLQNKMSEKEPNPFQKDDPYAPDNTIGVKIVKIKKSFGDGEHNITRKIFSLEDGKKHIIDYD